MRDQVFSGRGLSEALEAAARATGLPAEAVRYIILDPGSPGILGMSGTPARIAVLLDTATNPGVPEPSQGQAQPGAPVPGPREIVAGIATAAGLSLAVDISETEDELRLQLSGEGCTVFLERGGELFRAAEHLLQRMFGRDLAPRRLKLECEGYQELRDAALQTIALSLAASVRKDGMQRTTEPLNAYERRVIHVALSGHPGIRTFSVGEGQSRRVTIAPQADEPAGARG